MIIASLEMNKISVEQIEQFLIELWAPSLECLNCVASIHLKVLFKKIIKNI